jgi:subtilisin-like proprotein convertase family protein
MKNFTLLFSALLLTAFGWQANAQLAEDFEGAWVPAGWVQTAGSGNIDQSFEEPDHTSGAGLYARYDCYNTNTGPAAYLETPTLVVSATDKTFSFWANYYLVSGAWGNTASLGVDVSSDNGATWTLGTSNYIAGQDGAGWLETIIDLSSFEGQDFTGNNVIVRFNTISDWGSYNIGIDDVSGPAIFVPACPDPSLLTATNLTGTSADLGWTAGGTETMWDLEYGVAPYAPTGTPTVSGVTNPYNYSGLAPGSTYEFYVRADCGGTNGVSAWAGPYSFTTPGDCASSGSYDYVSNSTMASSLQSFVANTPGDYITLNFSAGSTETGWDYWFINDAADGSGATIATGDGPITGAYESTTGEISFYVESDGSGLGTTFVYGLSCSPPPSCVDPSALTAANITSSSADLTWTAGGTETMWDLEYGVAPYAPTGTPTVSGVTNPYNYSGLAPGTTYEFYVRADCGGTNGVSAWAGPYSFTTYGDCASSGSYDYVSNSTMASSLQSFVANTPGDYITLTFSAGSTETGWDYWFINDAADGSGATIATGDGPITGAYESTTGEISFYVESDGSGLGTTFTYGLSCSPPPSCVDPSALTTSNITPTSADLGWTENGTATSWEIEYDSTGFVQGTGNSVVTGTNPHSLTGLVANDSYDFYVRAICGVGDSSAWAGPYSFNTPCNTASITYTQDFTTWPMPCWDLTGGSQTWSDNGAGIALANFWNWSNPNDAIMSTEPINISVDARVRFDWSHLYSTTYPLDSLSLDVKVLPGGTWTSVWGKGGSDLESNDGAGNTAPGSMVTETILLDPTTYTGQDVQVRFVATSGYGPDLFVDNLIIEPLPACIDPDALTATNITTTSADLSWTENGTATSWEIEYDSTGFVQGTGNSVVTGTNPHSLTGLVANYSYDFYVRAICGVGDSSAWDGPFTFSTPCNAVTVFPFTESFEDSSATRNCWTNIQEAGTADWTYDTGSSGGAITAAYSGTKNARFVSASGAGTPATKLVSPEMDLTSISNPRVVFYYGQEDWFTDQNYTHLLYRDNPAAAWTMIWSDSTSVNAWTEAIVTLPSPSATYQIAFEGINNWGRANVVDEVVVEETPTDDLAVIDVTSSASSGCSLGNAETITVKVKNMGATSQSNFELGYSLNGTPISPEAITTALASGDTLTYTFTAVADLSTPMMYNFEAYSILSSDQNTVNDTMPLSINHITPSLVFNDSLFIGETANGTHGMICTNGLLPTQLDNCYKLSAVVIDSLVHTWDEDLNIYLISPNGDTIPLSIGNGGSGTDYIGVVFTDTAATSISSVTAGGFATGGYYLPEDPNGLGSYIGFDPNGMWELWIVDTYPSLDDGTLYSWHLEFEDYSFVVDLGPDASLCSGQDSLVLDAGAGAYTYIWSNMEATQTIVVNDSTVSTVDYSVIVTDSISMCEASDTVSVSFDDCSGVSELSGSTVSVYPNPSNGNFIISLSNISEQVSVQVVDMQGRIIYSQIEGLKVGKENVISLDNVERGVYLISVSSDKGRYTQSIVVE